MEPSLSSSITAAPGGHRFSCSHTEPRERYPQLLISLILLTSTQRRTNDNLGYHRRQQHPQTPPVVHRRAPFQIPICGRGPKGIPRYVDPQGKILKFDPDIGGLGLTLSSLDTTERPASVLTRIQSNVIYPCSDTVTAPRRVRNQIFYVSFAAAVARLAGLTQLTVLLSAAGNLAASPFAYLYLGCSSCH